jgi:hypothetical protein
MTLVRPRYQAWNVRHNVLPIIAADHPQMRVEGRERITGDLGAGGTHLPEKRGFSRVGEADETYVRKEPKLEAKPTRLTRPAVLKSARRLVCGRGEARISSSPTPTSDNLDFRPFIPKITEQLTAVFVENQRPRRDRKL